MQTQKIHVLNKHSNEPIESAYINVFLGGKSIKNGLTNINGEYEVNSVYDSIQIHSFGFEDKTFINNNKEKNTIYLKEKTFVLEEIILNSKINEIIIGQHKKKSSKQIIIGKEERFALLFNKPNEKKYKIKSILLNFKKIPYDTEFEINFYETNIIERDYKNQDTKIKTKLSEIIPNIKNNIGKFSYRINKNLSKQIVKIDLDSTNIYIPKTGVFMCIQTKNIFNENDLIEITSFAQFPVLYNHKTNENNFCVKIPNIDNHWTNENLVGRHHENTDNYHPLIPMNFYEPSISLKIIEIIE